MKMEKNVTNREWNKTRAVGGQPRSTISKFVTNELFSDKKGQNFTHSKPCDIHIWSIAIYRYEKGKKCHKQAME